MRVHLVTVPYRYDERNEGLGLGPQALIDGNVAGLLRASGLEVVGPEDVTLPDEERVSGPISANIGRLGSYTADRVAAARNDDSGVLVLAGDDTSSIGVVAGLQHAHGVGARIGVVWLDAHADFNTPETSYSGILAGMPVAILAGLAGPIWREAAGLEAPVPTDRILIVGPRELDEKEESLLRSTDVQLLSDKEIGDSTLVGRALARLTASVDFIYLHVDLDVLDPSLVPSSSTPARNGLTIEETVSIVTRVIDLGKVSAITVAGLNPGAGLRGRRSVASTLKFIEGILLNWSKQTGQEST